MYQKIIQFFREHLDNIILLIGVILISLLSFAMGFIVAKEQEKEPIKIEQHNPNIIRIVSECSEYSWYSDFIRRFGLYL